MSEEGWVRRLADDPHAPVAAVVVLGVGAVGEAVARAVTAGADPQLVLVLGLLALATTVPPAFLRPTAA
ncbi:MAG: hypothetical protein HOQ46_13035, partial [Saccharothrix sp.]|nr:hypothetical protein [Saccharothrix sp.]